MLKSFRRKGEEKKKMKKLMYLVIVASLMLALFPVAASADNFFQTDLMAGQNIKVGNVQVYNNGTHLTVKFNMTVFGWELTDTHVYVGVKEPTKAAPGQFPLKGGASSYTIALADIEGFEMPGKLYIAAHAVVNTSITLPQPPTGQLLMKVSAGGGSYLTTEIKGLGLTGTYPGWCVDTAHGIAGDTWMPADVFSSYDPNLPGGLVDYPENLDLVNWVLNHLWDYHARGFSMQDIQRAIWELIDDCPDCATFWPDTFSPKNVAEIVTEAEAHNGFEPWCGGSVALILRPTWPGQQISIIPWRRQCAEETAWASGTDRIKKGNWATYFAYDVE